MHIQSNSVKKAACNHFQGCDVFLVGAVHLGADVAYVLLDVPYALPRPSLVAEDFHITGVGLGIVSAYQRQKRGLSCTVLPRYGPTLPFVHRPAEVLEYGSGVVFNCDIVELEDAGAFFRRIEPSFRVFFVRQGQYGLPYFVLPGNSIRQFIIIYWYDAIDEGRHYFPTGHHQDYHQFPTGSEPAKEV